MKNKTTIRINGMTCKHCQKTVTEAISKLEGVENVEVSLEDKSAAVTFNEELIDPEKIKEAVEASGYGAFDEDTTAQPDVHSEEVQDYISHIEDENKEHHNCCEGEEKMKEHKTDHMEHHDHTKMKEETAKETEHKHHGDHNDHGTHDDHGSHGGCCGGAEAGEKKGHGSHGSHESHAGHGGHHGGCCGGGGMKMWILIGIAVGLLWYFTP